MSQNEKKSNVVEVDFGSISDEDLVGFLKINAAMLQVRINKLNRYINMTPQQRATFRESGKLHALYLEIMEETYLGMGESRD